MAEEAVVVLTTWPAATHAREAARTLVEERLAACGSIVPGVESIYRWEGVVESAIEVLLMLKTTPDRYAQLAARIKSLHPYAVPEIVALPVSAGSPAYLRWVEESCQ